MMADIELKIANNARLKALKELRDIVGFTPKLNGMLSAMSKRIVIDIIIFDRQLAQHYPEYDHQKCTFHGSECSMKEMIHKRFGDRALELVDLLMSP